MYDAIIVGARCAGSPTAMLLARKGHNVLVVDRAKFPSDTMSTHFIHPPGVARLNRWGLLDRLIATGCPPINSGRLDWGTAAVDAPFESTDLVPAVFSPRRTVLDSLLVDAAREAGAEVREGFYVESLIVEDGVVKGIRGRNESSEPVEERAAIVVGADGKNSVIAEMVQSPTYDFTETLACGYYGYYQGDFSMGADFRIREDRSMITFPTHGDAHVVIATWPIARFKEIRRDPEKHLFAAFEDLPEVHEPLLAAKRTEPILGAGDAPNYFRKAFGPGWALVGDAGHHKDPTPADGITDAFRGADEIAKAIDQGLSGSTSMEDAMSTFEQRRDTTSKRNLELTGLLSSYDRSIDERVQVFLEQNMIRVQEVIEISTGA